MNPKKLLKLRKKEKNANVRDRIMLIVHIKRDGMSITGAARHMGMAPSWGVKWHSRYTDKGVRRLQTRRRTGRPSRISKENMAVIRQKVKKAVYWMAEDLYDLILEISGVKYDISYVRRLLRKWGYTRKVPVGRHVRRANRQKVAWFRKKIKQLIEMRRRQGYTITVQDESIVLADARPRKGVYTPKGVRATYTYTGSHSKTVVFGVITSDGRGTIWKVRQIYQGRVCRLFAEGPRKVWQDADHC